MESREGRAARNEALFREVNERIEDVAQEAERLILMCECGDLECRETLDMAWAEYEGIRGEGDLFLVIPSHEDLSLERVVKRGAGFLVVEKLGEGGDVARDLDPRS